MDEDNRVWPPPTGFVVKQPELWRKYANILLFLLVCGGSMAVGAVAVPLLLILFCFLTGDFGSLIGFVFVMVFAALVGAFLGLIGGLILWFAGRPVLRWLVRRYLPRLLPPNPGK